MSWLDYIAGYLQSLFTDKTKAKPLGDIGGYWQLL